MTCRRVFAALAALLLVAAPAVSQDPDAAAAPAKTPLAELDGETLYVEDVEGAVAFRVYKHEVDIYSILKSEAERRVEALLLERAAAARGISVEALLEDASGGPEQVSDEEVEAYIAEHPADAAAAPDEVRARVRHYLGERRRIARRVALLEQLREQAGYRLLLPAPEPPRTEVDVAGAPARGPEDAAVVVVHFASFGSRNSARSAAKIAQLVEAFPGRIRQVHINMLNDRDERGLLAARIGVTAQAAGRFWELHDAWFAAGGKLDDAAIERLALESGLDAESIGRARTDAGTLMRVKHDLEVGNAAGAPREPTLFVNGRFASGLAPFAELKEIVEEELTKGSDDSASGKTPDSP